MGGLGNCCCIGHGYMVADLEWLLNALPAYDGSGFDADGCRSLMYLTETIQYTWFANDPGKTQVTATKVLTLSRYFAGSEIKTQNISTSCEGLVWERSLPDASPGRVTTYYFNPAVYDGSNNCNITKTRDGSGRITSGSLCMYCVGGGATADIGYQVAGEDYYGGCCTGTVIIDSATQKHRTDIHPTDGTIRTITWTLSDPISFDDFVQDALDVFALFDLTPQETPVTFGSSHYIWTNECDVGNPSLNAFYFLGNPLGTDSFKGREGLSLSIGNCTSSPWHESPPSIFHGNVFLSFDGCVSGGTSHCLWIAYKRRGDNCNAAAYDVRLRKSRLPTQSHDCRIFFPQEKDFLFQYHECGDSKPGGAWTTPAPECLAAAGALVSNIQDVPVRFGDVWLGDPGISGCPPPGGCC